MQYNYRPSPSVYAPMAPDDPNPWTGSDQRLLTSSKRLTQRICLWKLHIQWAWLVYRETQKDFRLDLDLYQKTLNNSGLNDGQIDTTLSEGSFDCSEFLISQSFRLLFIPAWTDQIRMDQREKEEYSGWVKVTRPPHHNHTHTHTHTYIYTVDRAVDGGFSCHSFI